MEQTKRTIRHRREIIEAAAGCALARTRADEPTARKFIATAEKWFDRQSVRQGLARRLFNETYMQEWAALHPE